MFSRLLGRGAAQPPPKDKLWARPREFDPIWQQRIAAMAAHIRPPARVADFGCGLMWLEEHLPKGCAYIPLDYVRRDERTIVFDLNKDPLPRLDADIAFFSGVLEYVENVPALAQAIVDSGFKQIIFSYCTLETHPRLADRLGLNWVSHLRLLELLRLFLRGFDLTALEEVNGNTIFVFSRKAHEDRLA